MKANTSVVNKLFNNQIFVRIAPNFGQKVYFDQDKQKRRLTVIL